MDQDLFPIENGSVYNASPIQNVLCKHRIKPAGGTACPDLIIQCPCRIHGVALSVIACRRICRADFFAQPAIYAHCRIDFRHEKSFRIHLERDAVLRADIGTCFATATFIPGRDFHHSTFPPSAFSFAASRAFSRKARDSLRRCSRISADFV